MTIVIEDGGHIRLLYWIRGSLVSESLSPSKSNTSETHIPRAPLPPLCFIHFHIAGISIETLSNDILGTRPGDYSVMLPSPSRFGHTDALYIFEYHRP